MLDPTRVAKMLEEFLPHYFEKLPWAFWRNRRPLPGNVPGSAGLVRGSCAGLIEDPDTTSGPGNGRPQHHQTQPQPASRQHQPPHTMQQRPIGVTTLRQTHAGGSSLSTEMLSCPQKVYRMDTRPLLKSRQAYAEAPRLIAGTELPTAY